MKPLPHPVVVVVGELALGELGEEVGGVEGLFVKNVFKKDQNAKFGSRVDGGH